jgi:hypothetical protein
VIRERTVMEPQQQNGGAPDDAVTPTTETEDARKVTVVATVNVKDTVGKRERRHERIVRWQDYRIKQLSFAISLFLSFAVASLAYAISLKLDGKTHDSIWLKTIIIWLAISAALGCVATVSRLVDYRCTEEKIKGHDRRSNSVISKCCGKITWARFWCQFATYFVGACWFIVNVLLT